LSGRGDNAAGGVPPDLVALRPDQSVGRYRILSVLGQGGFGKDKPSSLTLSGRIQPNGSASLTASGLNGKADYTVGFGQPGEKFSYPVTEHFDATRGTGLTAQGRTCRFTFVKL